MHWAAAAAAHAMDSTEAVALFTATDEAAIGHPAGLEHLAVSRISGTSNLDETSEMLSVEKPLWDLILPSVNQYEWMSIPRFINLYL